MPKVKRVIYHFLPQTLVAIETGKALHENILGIKTLIKTFVLFFPFSSYSSSNSPPYDILCIIFETISTNNKSFLAPKLIMIKCQSVLKYSSPDNETTVSLKHCHFHSYFGNQVLSFLIFKTNFS